MEIERNSLRIIVNPDGAAILDTKRGIITTLNSTGAFVWQALQRGESPTAIAVQLAAETREPLESVEKEVEDFIATLKNSNCIFADLEKDMDIDNKEAMDYRIIVVQRETDAVLGLRTVDGYRLPRVTISTSARRTKQLQEAISDAWQADVLILDFFVGTYCYATAQLLAHIPVAALREISLDQLAPGDLTEDARDWCRSSLGDITVSPFCHVGWIDEAILWLESVAQKESASPWKIDQYTAGGAFCLVNFCNADDIYWMKATGTPNAHEAAVTCCLSRLARQSLPEILGRKPEWNAWIMTGAATSLAESANDSLSLCAALSDAVQSMAALQMQTMGQERELLVAGAFDHSLEVLQIHSETLFEYLEEAMSHQTSTRVARIGRPRLSRIREILAKTCQWMSDLRIPNAIVHGDLNLGNIMKSPSGYQFIDWAEALVGNPLISLEHLLLLNTEQDGDAKRAGDRSLRDRYKQSLREVCDPSILDKAFLASPLIAAASALHGRGDWLSGSNRNQLVRQRYARTLARHMDRAASDPELLSVVGG